MERHAENSHPASRPGSLQRVTAPPEIDLRIWQVVSLIPPGTVATYGDVAGQAGLPGAARRVGKALRSLPADSRIPWHRVINARGKLSLPPGSRGRSTQRERLEAEGIYFLDGVKVDLAKYRWRPG